MRSMSRKGRRSSHEKTLDLLDGIRVAVTRERWGRHALQLAWTAGPVTYLALQGGYILGYGQSAPPSLVIYFAVYTVIAGLTAILVRVIHAATRGREVERDAVALRECLGILPRLLLVARDSALADTSPEEAPVIAAYHLLVNPDAEPAAVATAVEDLGGDEGLSRAMRRIEVFRRNGLSSRIAEERSTVEREFAHLLESLRERAPETAGLLVARSHGRPPSKRRGRARLEGFVERGLAGNEDEFLVTLADVEEIFTLAIELLAGRDYPLVVFDLRGDSDLTESWFALERARRAYRLAQRTWNSRIRLLAEILGPRIADVVQTIPRFRDPRALAQNLVSAMEHWAQSMDRMRVRGRARGELAAFRRAVQAYRYLEHANRGLRASHAKLTAAARRYEQLVERRYTGRDQPAFASGDSGDGIRVRESRVGLDESQRLSVAREIDELLRDPVSDDPGPDELRHLAVQVLAAVERHMPLYRPEVQQAIELTRAPRFESLEPGLSSEVRADWAAALVQEIRPNRAEYAQRRIERLIRFHGIGLSRPTLERLAARFGFSPESLEIAAAESAEANEPAWMRPPMELPARSEYFKAIAERGRNQVQTES
jgi:hypothetical protein